MDGFFNVDPLSEKYLYNSVYAFSENKITSHRELEGLEAVESITGHSQGNVKVTGVEPVFNKKGETWKVSHYNITFSITQTETFDLVENDMVVGSGERVTTSQHTIELTGGGLPAELKTGQKDNKAENFLQSGFKQQLTSPEGSGTEVTSQKGLLTTTESKNTTSSKVVANTGQILLNDKNSKELQSTARAAESKHNSPLKQYFRFILSREPEKKVNRDTPVPVR